MLQNLRKLQLTESQRDGMRRAGEFNAQLMDYVRPFVKPGISTEEIDRLVHEYTIRNKHQPATLGYLGYTKSCCTSVNDVICHGIPDSYVLKEGDIVNVDITSIVDGWHGDQSETFLVGTVSDEARAVTQCAFDAMHRAIAALEPGCTVSVIGDNVVAEATERGFSVVREYVGHGLGKRFHQYPNIPHVPDRKSRQERLLPGMCFTVEPMINVGTRFTKLDTTDNWTVRTKDGKLSAQFEHTVLMREDGPEILTQCPAGPKRGHRF
ncbi:Methionine aminopeptidase [Pirellula sp. SH-Sr6A]|uniref:type I methionyl aminopeptidase n=1 Tax=Pirellula sp. SH-Sr6A TaxID=1632865 RepID=UPI00078BE174|nr:type I methionyl aminopeptidase [Pirellula sp. SH-Sr6A]AMV35129.1 Methionine aminopeptidase [Pirellula sp. SH-Sr6A]